MASIRFWFDPSFAFFLSPGYPEADIVYTSGRRASVKDIIEALGVPHTEIGSLFQNGVPCDFSTVPEDGDRVKVLPISPPFDVTKKDLLRLDPLDCIRFVADVNVGKLAKFLLRIGFDTRWSNRFTDSEIAEIANNEKRIVLTRDTTLLKRNKIQYAKRIQASDPYLQLKEVLEFFGLTQNSFDFLSRCTFCNILLEPVDKNKILDRLEPKTKKYYTEFKRCRNCDRIFWKGSHHEDMKARFNDLGIRLS